MSQTAKKAEFQDRTYTKKLEQEQAELLEILEEADRPFLSLSDFEHRLENKDPVRNTIRNRLRALEAKNLIYEKALNPDQENPVNYYYLNNPHSDWPMPPDVEPQAAQNEITVEEFFNKDEINYGIKGIGIGFIGAGVTYLFAFLGALLGTNGVTGLLIYGGMSIGFLATIAAYIMVIQAVLQIFKNGDADILPYW